MMTFATANRRPRTHRYSRMPYRRDDNNREIATKNPLLAAWKWYSEPYGFNNYRTGLKVGGTHEDSSREYYWRQKMVRRYSFAIPDDGALEVVAKHGPIIEIGAGTGYWAHLLQQLRGVDILPVDINPPQTTKNDYGFKREYTPILLGSEDTIDEYPDKTLFICWPPMDDTAINCVRRYRGDTIIYVGEGSGGCTANDDFFDYMEVKWNEDEVIKIPQWSGMRDRMVVWRR